MKLKKTLTTFIVGAVAAVMLVGVAGCGSSDDNGEAAATPDPATYAPTSAPEVPGDVNGNGDEGIVIPPPPPPPPPPPNGNQQEEVPDRFFLDLPEYALISELHVGVPIVYGEEVASNSTAPWGHTNWTYRNNLQPATDENKADPRFLLYADRRGLQDDTERLFYGWYNFQAAEVPEWLHGAHFIGVGHEFRRNDRWPTPFFGFTAGEEMYAFLGMSQRMDAANYFEMLEGWELIYPVQFVSVIGALADRHQYFEDKLAMSEAGLLPEEGVRIPERLYLFQRRMQPGDSVDVMGASFQSGGYSGFTMIFLSADEYAARVPGGWDTVTAEYFVENLRPWVEDAE